MSKFSNMKLFNLFCFAFLVENYCLLAKYCIKFQFNLILSLWLKIALCACYQNFKGRHLHMFFFYTNLYQFSDKQKIWYDRKDQSRAGQCRGKKNVNVYYNRMFRNAIIKPLQYLCSTLQKTYLYIYISKSFLYYQSNN